MHVMIQEQAAVPFGPGSERSAETRTQAPGVLLALLACLPIAGTMLIAQVLPQLEAAFAGAADVRLRVALALTVPALAIALCSGVVGWLADRVGKRRLLTVAMLLYAVFGLLPLVLHDLNAIIAVRAGMGVAEGIIMTCSTALIGDLYTAARRERLLSLQTACASVAAVIFALIGGALGTIGWRAPFAVYSMALFALPVMLMLVPSDGRTIPVPAAPSTPPHGELPFARLAIICFATVVLSLGFYVAQIQTPYLLNALGPVAPSTVGMMSAASNFAVVIGTLCFGRLRHLPLAVTGVLCFSLLAAGLAIAGLATAYPYLAAGLFVASFAGGIALPTFLNGAMALLPAARRGQGAGWWQSSFWSGQFASPILIIALTGMSGSLGSAVLLCSVGTLALGVAAATFFPTTSNERANERAENPVKFELSAE